MLAIERLAAQLALVFPHLLDRAGDGAAGLVPLLRRQEALVELDDVGFRHVERQAELAGQHCGCPPGQRFAGDLAAGTYAVHLAVIPARGLAKERLLVGAGAVDTVHPERFVHAVAIEADDGAAIGWDAQEVQLNLGSGTDHALRTVPGWQAKCGDLFPQLLRPQPIQQFCAILVLLGRHVRVAGHLDGGRRWSVRCGRAAGPGRTRPNGRPRWQGSPLRRCRSISSLSGFRQRHGRLVVKGEGH